MRGFASIVHLLGRHPELASQTEFQNWLRKYGGDLWHETARSFEGHRTVVVQSPDRLHVFGALINTVSDFRSYDDLASRVLYFAHFDLLEQTSNPFNALSAVAAERGLLAEQIQAVRPVIDFDEVPAELSWEVEVLKAEGVDVFRVDLSNQISGFETRIIEAFESGLRPEGIVLRSGNDWLASNELHHPDLFRAEAEQWTAAARTVIAKARAIWQNVSDSYSYDSTIERVKEFTFADKLVRDQLLRKGVCDEFAVVMTTYLRALEIPAVIKLLNFQVAGPVGHACVEFFDGNRWIHADPVYRAFDRPSVYRSVLARNVLVMDADFPRDDRCDEPSFGLPDVAGDLQLNPYTDFLLNPQYPGNQRPGYSY